MAGTLTIDTLKASSGVLATQNGMTGIAKAWVNFNGTGTVAIRDSFNVSSITRVSTGTYTVSFTTAMANANYAVAPNWQRTVTFTNSGIQALTFTASSFQIIIIENNVFVDEALVNAIVCGS